MGDTGLEPVSDDISISDYDKDTYVKNSEHFQNQKVQNTVQICAKAQKLELIKKHLPDLSDGQIEQIIGIIFQLRND
jgi:hypothetical protein